VICRARLPLVGILRDGGVLYNTVFIFEKIFGGTNLKIAESNLFIFS